MEVIIDGTNGITSVNGTAAAPSVTGADTDTGIVYGTNTLSLATGGTTAVMVDSSQNVGIGTSSPSQKLDVAGNIAISGQTGATATPKSISFSLDYSNSSVAAGCKLFFYNGTATDTYGLGVGADSDIQYHSGGVPTNNNGKHRFFVNNTEALRITPTGLLQFDSGYGSVATAYGCRAWVNFNGIGTVAIKASGNVSSITDNGVGNYTVNYTNAISDANYCASAFGVGYNANDTVVGTNIGYHPTGVATYTPILKSTTQSRFMIGRGNAAASYDLADISFQIFR